MGMDNTFFKIRKDEIKDIEHKDIEDEVRRIVYNSKKYTDYKLAYFRKNYALNDAIEDVLESYMNYKKIIVSEEKLKEIYKKLFEEMREYNGKIDKETEDEMWERINITHTVEVLEVIIKLFDFENYYLIYEVLN